MKRLVPALLATTLFLTAGCTAAQVAQVQQLAGQYLASLQLTSTDENGVSTVVSAAEVLGVELDGKPIAATFNDDGEMQLPEGDYSKDRQVRVRLKDGSNLMLPLNGQAGHVEGRQIRFAGALHRQGGKLVAADVLPGGRATEEQRLSAVRKQYVRIAINRPGLSGRLKARGIDRNRLPQDAFFVTPQGDLMINRAMLQRFARPGSTLWAVVQTGAPPAGAGGPGRRPAPRPGAQPGPAKAAPGGKHVLFVLKLNRLPQFPPMPAPASDGTVAAAPSAPAEVVLNDGTDVTVVQDETSTTEITNPESYTYDGSADGTADAPASPSASPSPAAAV